MKIIREAAAARLKARHSSKRRRVYAREIAVNQVTALYWTKYASVSTPTYSLILQFIKPAD
jgi:hypothetical protein